MPLLASHKYKKQRQTKILFITNTFRQTRTSMMEECMRQIRSTCGQSLADDAMPRIGKTMDFGANDVTVIYIIIDHFDFVCAK